MAQRDKSREEQAQKRFEMISPREAGIRKWIGEGILVLLSVYSILAGLISFPLPSTGMAGLGWGVGVMLLRMGQQSQ